jgi:Na+/H+ antiporter NhaD/arsenite permease-like protein
VLFISSLQGVLQQFNPSIYISLAFLFGIAAQFRAMDGYSLVRRVISNLERRFGILYAVVIITAVLSPLILNDVVILILTPVLARYAKQFKVDIAPLLVAEITFTNIASSLTPLGNPQNILLWQASGLSAGSFVAGTWFPLLLSGLLSAALLYPLSRREGGSREFSAPAGSFYPALYLLAVVVTIFSSDLLGIPDTLALGISFLIGFLFTFRSLVGISREFDLRSLLTLFLLVASVTAIAAVARPILEGYASMAASGNQPFSALFVGGLSNVISNVPTTQLLLSLSSIHSSVAPKIAVEAGLAGNLDPIASFANILALILVKRAGLPIRKAVILQLGIGIVSFLPAFL